MSVSIWFNSLFAPRSPAVSPEETFRAAVAAFDAPTVSALLAASPELSPDTPLEGEGFPTRRTALQHAVRMEDAALAKALLSAGASPNAATDEEWFPPTHRAVLSEQKNMCLLLKAAGADWTATATDPMVGEAVSAAKLVVLRQRGDAEFAQWFAASVAPLPVSSPRSRRSGP